MITAKENADIQQFMVRTYASFEAENFWFNFFLYFFIKGL